MEFASWTCIDTNDSNYAEEVDSYVYDGLIRGLERTRGNALIRFMSDDLIVLEQQESAQLVNQYVDDFLVGLGKKYHNCVYYPFVTYQNSKMALNVAMWQTVKENLLQPTLSFIQLDAEQIRRARAQLHFSAPASVIALPQQGTLIFFDRLDLLAIGDIPVYSLLEIFFPDE